MTIPPISRYRAAAIHVTISAVIAAAALAVMLLLWYPPPLFKAMGGMELALLIIGVDVAIGPLITLIIFDTRKKELVFDLAVIAVLQMAALSYGVYAMHSGRPVFTVFNGQYLAVVSANELDENDLAQGPSEVFRTLSLTGPHLVAVEPPTDPEALSSIAFGALAGLGIQHLPKYYVTYGEKRAQVLAATRPLMDLELNVGDKQRLERYLVDSGRKEGELRGLPVMAKHTLLTAVIDAKSGDLLSILNIEPNIAPK